jgi:predicted RNA-binding protein with PUA-like domain
VDLVPVKPLKKSVSLDEIKADKILKDMALVKRSRLSVSPVTETQFNRVLELAGEK